jgi:hypothetical protein
MFRATAAGIFVLVFSIGCVGCARNAPTVPSETSGNAPPSAISSDAELFTVVTQTQSFRSYKPFPNLDTSAAGTLPASSAHQPLIRVTVQLDVHRTAEDCHGRGTRCRNQILRSAFVAAAAGLGFGRFAPPARAQTKHIRLYVEMDVAPAREREMLDTFHNVFVPEAVQHEGYIRVKMLKRRAILQGTPPENHNHRFELEFESEELRQKWIASAGHQRVWPPVERTMTTLKDYPVVLYDEV